TANTSTAPTPAPPTGILTFRTEQIYISNADGSAVKSVTQTDGLIYFYYAWAPDSSALVALASTQREWQFLQFRAESNGEIFVPVGRPRIVEKNGRERRLDDGLSAVHPVWSSDSTKVACAFDTQIRIYDATGTSPTQAAIPLRNQLLISSQAYDREQQQKLDANQTPESNTNNQVSTLPDEKSLVSFNPIVALAWPEDGILYFQTAFVKRMKKEIDSVTSFPRWHRLVLTAQATTGR
ncbi:MAG: TolB family protein, partial [Pyrinomonadaceae bacterium]